MGNWFYKEWSQLESDNEMTNETCKQKNKLKRKSLTNFNVCAKEIPNETRRSSLGASTPQPNKVIMADFDPRSPSNGIPR